MRSAGSDPSGRRRVAIPAAFCCSRGGNYQLCVGWRTEEARFASFRVC